MKTVILQLTRCQVAFFYQRDVAGVGTGIFNDWAHNFVAETKELWPGGQKMIIIMDSYEAHTR